MITTVVPSHGRRSTLVKAVASAVNAGSDEVFVLDTVGDVKSSELPDSVRIVRAPDRGITENWNQCLGLGSGEWVHVLHDDDFVAPAFYDGCRKYHGVAHACGYENIDEFGRTSFQQNYSCVFGEPTDDFVISVEAPTLLNWLTRGNIFRPSAVVMRRDVALRLRFRSVGADDWDMFLRLANAGTWWFDRRPLLCNMDHKESDGAKHGPVVRAAAVRGTIEATEAWLKAPYHMLSAREQYARVALMEGAVEEADRLAMRGKR